MRNKIWLIFFFLFAFCKPKENSIPTDLVAQSKLIEVLVEIHLSDALINFRKIPKDSVAFHSKVYHNQIFEQQRISREDFVRTYEFYEKNPELLAATYEIVLEELSKKEAELR